MTWLIFSVVVAFLLVLLSEELSQKKKISTELSRKIPHMLAGIAIATWPFFVSMRMVVVGGVLFFIASILVRRLDLFAHSRRVNRLSWGDYFFPIGVIATALLGPDKWIFAAAILHLGIADAIAALVGKQKGTHRYKLLKYTKTIEGTIAFMVVSILITNVIVILAPGSISNQWSVVFWLPLVAAGIEAITPWGFDNLFVPLTVVALLSLL